MLAVLSLLFALGSLAQAPIPDVTREFLFPLNTYPYNHVCSLVQLPDASIRATFQAGPAEADPQLKIWTVKRDASTGTWGTPTVAIDGNGYCVMNAVQYRSTDETIYLMYHSGSHDKLDPYKCSTHSWKGYFMYSKDGGETWGANSTYPGCDECAPEDTMQNCCLGSVKNNCLMMSNNEVICPSSNEAIVSGYIGIWTGHFEITDDKFTKWKRTNSVDFFVDVDEHTICQGVIQPTVFETSPGNLTALLRSSCGVLGQTWSTNYGHNWTERAVPTAVANPGAGVDGTSFADQPDLGLILAFNNSTSGRNPLTLAQSLDNGMTWKNIVNLASQPGESYGYPYIIRDRFSPRIGHLCYTYSGANGTSMGYMKLTFPSLED